MTDSQSRGLYTLANDTVYDQLVALLNSIEKNIGLDIPICVIPYNDSMDLVNIEVEKRPQVSIFDNRAAIDLWDTFISDIWAAHPRENAPKHTRPGWYKGFVHRKFASFFGPFERFIFFDADSLAMKPVDDIFDRLDDYDLIFNDWEHVKRDDIPEVIVDELASCMQCEPDAIYPQLHCDSFFGSKRGIIDAESLNRLKKFLIDEGGVRCVRDRCWWSSSGLFSVMTIREKLTLFNFTRSPKPEERTGNCADADPFVDIDGVLYNEQGRKPIHRIHYMNYASADFARLCQGEEVNIRYEDTFLNYRFMKEPKNKPECLLPPSPLEKAKRKSKKIYRKIQKFFP